MINLSRENVLKYKVTEIDTWPYSPKGTISTDNEAMSDEDMERITNEHKERFSEIDKVVKNIFQRQIVVVFWLTAIAIGILGNFIVNLFFGTLSFQLSYQFLALLVLGLVSLGILTYIIFLYFPTSLLYQIYFRPPWHYPSSFLPPLKEDELSLEARLKTSYNFAFHEVIVKFASLISIAILRDNLNLVDMNVLKVSDLSKMSPDFPFYFITFDFKSKYLFWLPNIADKVRSELIKINNTILRANISIGVRAVDHNEDRWINRGHVFLNEISQWDIDDVIRKIEIQIKS
ncbi:MAG: hypothetical protein ACE5Z5_09845 [Candidatus Bathyarchaeia archaeon]